jgi:hypothetical protein
VFSGVVKTLIATARVPQWGHEKGSRTIVEWIVPTCSWFDGRENHGHGELAELVPSGQNLNIAFFLRSKRLPMSLQIKLHDTVIEPLKKLNLPPMYMSLWLDICNNKNMLFAECMHFTLDTNRWYYPRRKKKVPLVRGQGWVCMRRSFDGDNQSITESSKGAQNCKFERCQEVEHKLHELHWHMYKIGEHKLSPNDVQLNTNCLQSSVSVMLFINENNYKDDDVYKQLCSL